MNTKRDSTLELVIKTNSYAGNFERELIGYTFGVLEAVQMEIDYAENERDAFWQEVMGKASREKYVDSSFPLWQFLDDSCVSEHDGEYYSTFYAIAEGHNGENYYSDSNKNIHLYLLKEFDAIWLPIIISRIKKFFSQSVCNPDNSSYMRDLELLGLELYENGKSIKTY